MQVICFELCACAYILYAFCLEHSHGPLLKPWIMPRRPSRLWTLDREDTNEAFKGF